MTDRIVTWLRRASRTEEDKGNLWLSSQLTSLADWLERKHVDIPPPVYCEFCGAGGGIPHKDWCPRK